MIEGYIMNTAFVSPGRYYQKPGIINDIGEIIKPLSDNVFILIDEFVFSLIGERVQKSFSKNKVKSHCEIFSGECSQAEIDRVLEITKNNSCNAIIAIGGGKTLDTGKAVSHALKVLNVVVPTIASTDAPTSSLVVIYDENHMHVDAMILPKNPDLVLVDSEVIINAPVRFFVAGIGDALATKYEADACFLANSKNFHKSKSSSLAMAIADLCHNTILECGVEAKQDFENKKLTKAVNRIIESNILLSGLGFENGGESIAHSLATALGMINETNAYLHGEKVAVGVLFQLFCDNKENKEIKKILPLYKDLGLPVSFEDVGWLNPTSSQIAEISKRMSRKGSIAHNVPYKINEKYLIETIDLFHVRSKNNFS